MFALLLPEHPQIWAFTRTLNRRALLVLANVSSEPVAVPAGELPDLTGADVLLATHRHGDPGLLQPWESRIYRLA